MSRVIAVVCLLGWMLLATSAGAVDRTVVMEHFTNTSCGPCGTHDPWIKQFIFSHTDEELVVVSYHVWWPSSFDPFYRANTVENAARTNFYGVNSVPHVIFDGRYEPTYPYYVANLEATYDHAASRPTTVVINPSGTYSRGAGRGTGTIRAEVIAEEEQTGTDLRLVIALCENGIHWNAPNGIQDHYWVMRDLVPDANGTPVIFSAPYPDTVVVSHTFTINPDSVVADSCHFAIFLQNFGPAKKIKQGAKIWVSDLQTTEVAVNDVDFGVRSVGLGQNFPNPCNPATVIPVTIAREGLVSLRIYDVEGRQVRSLVESSLLPGTHKVEWDGRDDLGQKVASGIYYCRLDALGEGRARKLVVVR